MRGGGGTGSRPAVDAIAYVSTSGVLRVGALVIGVALVALAVASGGVDPGEGAVGPGPTAAFLALALGAPAAMWVAWWAAPRGAFRLWPVGLGLGAAAGLVVWNALSILWAAGPDLAWLEANRAALALCALVLGVALAHTTPCPGATVAVGFLAIAVPVVAWGLATKITPSLVGPDLGFARLSEPMDYWNAVALIAALAVPGALWLTTRPNARATQRALGAAALTTLIVTILLTYSRAGIVVAIVVVGLCMWLTPRGLALLGAFIAGSVGAVLPLAYALTTDALTTDRIPAAERRDAGIALGWRLGLGLLIAAALVLAALRLAPRLHPHSGSLRRMGRIGLLVVVAGLIVAGGVRFDSIANRVDRLGDDAVGNTSGRLTDPSLNRRVDWAAEAMRGFADAPLTGQGAGGFRLIHLAERESAPNPRESVQHPHQLATQVAGELGIVGLLLLIALVGAVAWAAARARRRGSDPTIGFAIASAAGFLLHAQVDFTWSIPGVAVPALIACGVVLAGAGAGPAAAARRALPWWAAPGLAVLAAVAAGSAFLPWQATRSLEAAYTDRPFAHIATARSLNPLWIEPDVVESRFAATTDAPRALDAARHATEKQPDNPRAWRQLIAAGATGDEAALARSKVLALDPKGVQP